LETRLLKLLTKPLIALYAEEVSWLTERDTGVSVVVPVL